MNSCKVIVLQVNQVETPCNSDYTTKYVCGSLNGLLQMMAKKKVSNNDYSAFPDCGRDFHSGTNTDNHIIMSEKWAFVNVTKALLTITSLYLL